jgi:hypothetical protein
VKGKRDRMGIPGWARGKQQASLMKRDLANQFRALLSLIEE